MRGVSLGTVSTVMATATCLAAAPVVTATVTLQQAPEIAVLGEERVIDVGEYAERVQAEAQRILATGVGKWDYYGGGVGNLAVYTRPVAGSQLSAVRSEARIPLNATKLFSLLTSDAGFAIIDPNSRDSQHLRPLAWDEGKAEETLSFTPLPWPAAKRSTLAASFADPEKRLLVTKSILDDEHPPGSDGCVRAFNSFALLVEPVEGNEAETASRLALFDTVDLRGSFSAFFTNHFLKGTFCQGIQQRLYDHLQAEGLVGAPEAA